MLPCQHGPAPAPLRGGQPSRSVTLFKFCFWVSKSYVAWLRGSGSLFRDVRSGFPQRTLSSIHDLACRRSFFLSFRSLPPFSKRVPAPHPETRLPGVTVTSTLQSLLNQLTSSQVVITTNKHTLPSQCESHI